MRIAIVHDWLTGMRGGERCLESLCRLFPRADLHTLLHLPGKASAVIEKHKIRTSFIQDLPRAAAGYRNYLPLFPLAAEMIDLSGYELVLSSSHCAAKGVVPDAGALHLCYCHTPMRYLWDQYDFYFGAGRASPAKRAAMALLAPSLRRWDVRSSARVDAFSANSHTVAERIRRIYGRDSEVIHPPVDCDHFGRLPAAPPEDYYLVVSALVPYKRIDLAIEACSRLGRRLLVVGTGPEAGKLTDRAGPETRFLGYVGADQTRELYRRCRALLFPGLEDFGITPLEAMATGRPVVAYGRGGVTESVVDGQTGIFFPEQTAPSLEEGILRFERWEPAFDPETARARARQFDRPRFEREFLAFVRRHAEARGLPA
jgi:glycosyltransferase involved in cell wall biosynthesis